jgi:hypothetical protein
MRSRRNVFLTIAMAAGLWAWSGGVASAQICDGECPPPPGIVNCAAPYDTGDGIFQPTCTGLYTTDQKVNVFFFGNDNSIQIKFPTVSCSFSVTVQLKPTTQAAFHDRLKSTMCTTPPAPLSDDGTGPPEVTCNETVLIDVGVNDDPTSFCAVYSVSVNPIPPLNTCYTGGVFNEQVEYLVGWQAPAKGNKHDFFLLRDPDQYDPNYNATAPLCFIQNITSGTVIRNYTPGDIRDPGLGGRACCPSDYVVARQKIRPVAK